MRLRNDITSSIKGFPSLGPKSHGRFFSGTSFLIKQQFLFSGNNFKGQNLVHLFHKNIIRFHSNPNSNPILSIELVKVSSQYEQCRSNSYMSKHPVGC